MKFIKLFSTLTVLLYIASLSAQNDTATEVEMTNVFNSGHAGSNFGMSTYFVNPKRTIDGTVYLFDNWENYAVIYATNHQRYLLHNINLNIQRNSFESKVGKDSLFAFSFNNIEKFVINGRVFKNYYWDNDNRVYEVIADGKNFEILKGFSVKYIEGSPNPMLNRNNDRYVRYEKYYVKKDNKIGFLSLRKSRILRLLDLNDQQRNKVLAFVDERKLSFKKEEDLRVIIDFASKLKYSS